jgi:hypothetical protein
VLQHSVVEVVVFVVVVDSVVEVRTELSMILFHTDILGGGDSGGYRGRGEYFGISSNNSNGLYSLIGGDRGGEYRGGGRGASHGSGREQRSNPY